MLVFDTLYRNYPVLRVILSFNPCFSGCWSSTNISTALYVVKWCFNPCFSGCWSSTFDPTEYRADEHTGVSILVLVDVGLRLGLYFWIQLFYDVSILVLVDVGLRPRLFYLSGQWKGVSILVLVDVGLRPYNRSGVSMQVTLFQSLF